MYAAMIDACQVGDVIKNTGKTCDISMGPSAAFIALPKGQTFTLTDLADPTTWLTNLVHAPKNRRAYPFFGNAAPIRTITNNKESDVLITLDDGSTVFLRYGFYNRSFETTSGGICYAQALQSLNKSGYSILEIDKQGNMLVHDNGDGTFQALVTDFMYSPAPTLADLKNTPYKNMFYLSYNPQEYVQNGKILSGGLALLDIMGLIDIDVNAATNTLTGETSATATVTITHGATGDTFDVHVNGVSISGLVQQTVHDTTDALMAEDIVYAINGTTSINGGYTASAIGNVITITAPVVLGASLNTVLPVTVIQTEAATGAVGVIIPVIGTTGDVFNVKVGGTTISGDVTVTGAETTSALMAAKIAAAITSSFSTNGGYTATNPSANNVLIFAPASLGSSLNGTACTATITNVNPSNTAATATVTVSLGATNDTIRINVSGLTISGLVTQESTETTATLLASKIAAQIGSLTGINGGYSATSAGAVITITAATSKGSSLNGISPTATVTGTVSATETAFTGGLFQSSATEQNFTGGAYSASATETAFTGGVSSLLALHVYIQGECAKTDMITLLGSELLQLANFIVTETDNNTVITPTGISSIPAVGQPGDTNYVPAIALLAGTYTHGKSYRVQLVPPATLLTNGVDGYEGIKFAVIAA